MEGHDTFVSLSARRQTAESGSENEGASRSGNVHDSRSINSRSCYRPSSALVVMAWKISKPENLP